LLLITLIVLDDLVFGWIFWALAQINPFLSATVAFLSSWSFSYWLTVKGLSPNPGKVAALLLSRFQLGHKNPELQRREQELLNKITSIGIAIPMTLLFGGVVTTLWLRRKNVVSATHAYRLGFILTGVYAVEVALVHGLGIGGSIFFFRQ
jgi:hypothetical protein